MIFGFRGFEFGFNQTLEEEEEEEGEERQEWEEEDEMEEAEEEKKEEEEPVSATSNDCLNALMVRST